jgi:hypothetical protein
LILYTLNSWKAVLSLFISARSGIDLRLCKVIDRLKNQKAVAVTIVVGTAIGNFFGAYERLLLAFGFTGVTKLMTTTVN